MTDEIDALNSITDKVLSYKPTRKARKSKSPEGSPTVKSLQPIRKQPGTELLIYQSSDGKTRIDVMVGKDTVWLSQAQMAELFQTSKQNISLHIKNIFEERELQESATVKESLTVQIEGGREVQRKVDLYNLDVIISVGYRVKSHRGTQFRIWATNRLREYIIKGFTLDDERLKDGGTRNNYFDELIERVRAIRTSEKNFYRKITDIYATSYDYDAATSESKKFFSTVQNKFHWAITHRTAAEIVAERADARQRNMGLTSWRGEKIHRSDAHVAKNYLSIDELKMLNLIVDQYLSFAEFQAQQRKPMYMKDWAKKLDQFLTLNDRDILTHAGTISARLSDEIADREFEKYSKEQDRLESEEIVKELESEIQNFRVERDEEEDIL